MVVTWSHRYTEFLETEMRFGEETPLTCLLNLSLQVTFQLDLFSAKTFFLVCTSMENGWQALPTRNKLSCLQTTQGYVQALDVWQGSCWLWQRRPWLGTGEVQSQSIWLQQFSSASIHLASLQCAKHWGCRDWLWHGPCPQGAHSLVGGGGKVQTHFKALKNTTHTRTLEQGSLEWPGRRRRQGFFLWLGRNIPPFSQILQSSPDLQLHLLISAFLPFSELSDLILTPACLREMPTTP